MRPLTRLVAGCALTFLAGSGALAYELPARAAPTSAKTSIDLRPRYPGHVYQGTLTSHNVCSARNLTLPSWHTYSALAGREYPVTATVAGGHLGNDQIVCATAPASLGDQNDGIFGTAGNGSPGGIYGTATITDTWIIKKAGDTIDLGCNAFNFGKGTYTGSASITALAVQGLTKTSS